MIQRHVAFGAVLMAGALAALQARAAETSRPLLADAYPRAFHFRQSEGLAAQGKMSFEEWDAIFSVLDGIMGKCLDEEIPNRSRRNIEFFTRYKDLHPEKTVLLHFNGNARDPRFEAAPYHAGHWLYYDGCRVTEDVPAESGETTIHVKKPALFKTNIGRFDDKNDDVALCMIDEDGKPDWSRAEQVELLGVDMEAKTLRVRRGAFGTKPMAFPAGEAYVAAHVTEGPWGRNSNLLWAYNYATTCPADTQGQVCADLLVDDLCRWFGSDGPLAAFDGIEFDVLHFHPHGGGGRGPDVDADGMADRGVVDGVNVYGFGVHGFLTNLRARLGDERLIMADGHGPRHQRSIGLLNGIESEGWPDLRDTTVSDWSGGLNRHAFWTAHARRPALSYINHRFMEAGKPTQVPHNITRLVLASAQFTDSAVTFSMLPPKPAGARLGVWDELVMGVEQRTGWLGRPLRKARHLAFETPDVLAGEDWVEVLQAGADTSLTHDASWIRMEGDGSNPVWTRSTITGLRIEGPDLVVRCTVRGESPFINAPELPRLLQVACRADGHLITPSLPVVHVGLRNQPRALLRESEPGARLVYREKAEIAGERHEAYFAHPPFGQGFGPGHLVWSRDVHVPDASPVLSFHTGLSKAPNPSDGVTFRIEVDDAKGTRILFEQYHTAYEWQAHRVDMAPWKGREMEIRFVTDCGPNDHTTADHAYWGDVYMHERGARSQDGPSQAPVMAWAHGQPSSPVFYFRNVGPGLVNLCFEAEGGASVWLSDLTAHCAPDAMCREFENGLVLANPSDAPVTFDIRRLAPGKRFRHLEATPEQDTEVNSGAHVGDTVTLPPRDGRFLVRVGPVER
ncbi:MAG: hypothetical protein GY851_14335 [bacterium]|nr:hypothetical protein [bacterium]